MRPFRLASAVMLALIIALAAVAPVAAAEIGPVAPKIELPFPWHDLPIYTFTVPF